jgi:A/G-specific adenine glycosylase
LGKNQPVEKGLLFPAREVPPPLRGWLRRRLLSWFGRFQRSLPWREDRNPYRIWVSEVMLQQTQVATVVPYFERFLEAFPTLADLAAAAEQDVLRRWEGLGYYRRARHLHRAARHLVAGHEGQVPNDPVIIAALPGVGRYMLGAILSQAYDRRLPILEANSIRVLCRFFGRRDNPRSAKAQAWLWAVAGLILPARKVGDFNQALMELGALVCTPARPHCTECPLARKCLARRGNLQDTIPFRPKPPPVVPVLEAAVVIGRGTRVFLVQRPEQGRWAGLWEFPHGLLHLQETPEEGASRIVREFTGLEATLGDELITIRHGVTRFRITLVCFEARFQSGKFWSAFYRRGKWVAIDRLGLYPVSMPQRRLAQALVDSRQRKPF